MLPTVIRERSRPELRAKKLAFAEEISLKNTLAR
jgi:hypothetical protein